MTHLPGGRTGIAFSGRAGGVVPSSTLLMKLALTSLALASLITGTALAADAPKAPVAANAPAAPIVPVIPPTLANVAYGTDRRQILDFYKAESSTPTPLMFFIHGGGWVAGSKAQINGLAEVLAAGISVVSVEYRFIQQAIAAGVMPPVEWPIHDAARALQFVRSKAAEWNIDKERIGACGGSAGACSSLWLAFHPDLADPKSSDPIARESTRLWCAAVSGAQTSLDPLQLKEWTPNSRYGGHAFGFFPNPLDNKTRDTDFANFYANREKVLPWIKIYSPIEHVTADDPAIYLTYAAAPALGQPQRDPTHTANYGVKLQEKCKGLGVPCELNYPGTTEVTYKTMHEYLIAKLKAAK